MERQGLNQTVMLPESLLDRIFHLSKGAVALIAALSAPMQRNPEMDVMVSLSDYPWSTVVIVRASDDSPMNLTD
jgi:hypothetical protein